MSQEFAHVRWIGGGTGAGKSTVTALLARGREVTVYDGDAGEAGYLARCTPERQPLLHALAGKSPRDMGVPPDEVRGRLVPTPEEVVAAMPSLHGETFPLVLEDLRALPADRPLLVDDFLPQTPSGGTPSCRARSRPCWPARSTPSSCCRTPPSAAPCSPPVTPTPRGPVPTGTMPTRRSCWSGGWRATCCGTRRSAARPRRWACR